MSSWEEYKPAAGMVAIQLMMALMAVFNKAALVKGMSPMVFIFYRQLTATIVIFPFALFSTRKKGTSLCVGLRGFLLIFTLALFGVTLNLSLFYEGLYLSSSSVACAMTNSVPAVTFLLAAIFRLERVNIRSWNTIAKILGTLTCVGGAASIAFLKGPKLLNAVSASLPLPQANSLTLRLGLVPVEATWLLGCLFLFGNSVSTALWLILQVPATKACPDHLSISAWTCLFSTIQSGLVALLLDPSSEAWNLSSALELTCVFFSGIAGSGLQYVIQSWCISRRGPLYSAMFNPLCTVIVTILAAIFLHEQLYVGSLMGSVVVIVGLYVVLWGKSKETEERKIKDEESSDNDLEQTLLPQEEQDINMIS